MENPYSPPQASLVLEGDSQAAREYGGIGRLAYLGLMIGLGILQNVLLVATSGAGADRAVVLLLLLVFVFLSFMPVYYRLQNIGMNPWWCLLMLVPIVNMLVGVRCLICPEGYADTKQLDAAGKVITVIACVVVGLFVLGVVLAVVAVS